MHFMIDPQNGKYHPFHVKMARLLHAGAIRENVSDSDVSIQSRIFS